MIKKLLEKHKQKQYEKFINKPVYQLGDLYVGEIVLYVKRECVGSDRFNHHYRIVKKFAFLYKVGYEKYRHVISAQPLIELGGYNSVIGDYAVHNVRKFQEVFPIYMRKNNLTPSSKVSLQFIIDGEKIMNEKYAFNQDVNELFQ